MKATEHSGRFVLNDSARTRPSSWRRCDDVLDYIWKQKMLLQDKTSKIEKLQQLLHSERQRMELLIGAVLVCVFLLSFLKALRDWLLPRIHGEVRKACLSEQSEGWPFPQHDWFESCCRRRDG